MMVESEAYELSEKEMLGAVKFGHDQMQKVIDLIISLAEKTAKEPYNFIPTDNKELKENYSVIDHILTTKNLQNKI